MSSLKRVIEGETDTWDEHLKPVQFAVNRTPCKTTGMSSYELVFGRLAYLPIDFALPVPEVAGKGMQGQVQNLTV